MTATLSTVGHAVNDGRDGVSLRPAGQEPPVHLGVIATVVPVIFVAELPDKTMFASLLLASRGRPVAVWVGAAAAFSVHVGIAVTVGVGLFALLPHRAIEAFVAALFLGSAIYVFATTPGEEEEVAEHVVELVSARRTVVTAFGVIFVAEWGDLTQVLTANLAARYHTALSVAIGSVLALWAVAAVAVVSGQSLLRFVPMRLVRRITGVVLVLLAAVAAVSAIR